VLHLLHGWSDGDETTGQPQRRSTRQHHSAINRPSSAPVNVVRGQHLPPSTRPPSSTPLLLRMLPSSTRSSSTPLVSLDYRSQHHQDHSLGLHTWITHMDYLSTSPQTTADYPRSRTTNYNNIVCHCITCPWPYSSYELFYHIVIS